MEAEKLTSKDLMVGDWVGWRLNDNDTTCTSVKIAEIHYMGVKIDWAVYPPYERIEPIPITPEVLEKNGFFVYERAYLLQGTTYRIRLGRLSETQWNVSISSLEDGSYLMDKTIRYIHQLQHFMRDFEIEKEITL